MGTERVGSQRARWLLAGVAGAALALGSAAWGGTGAAASVRAGVGRLEGSAVLAGRHPRHGPRLPVVGNAAKGAWRNKVSG